MAVKSPAVLRQDARRAQRHVPLASLFISETSDWPSIESSHALSNKDGGRGRNRLPWYEGGKLRAIHQWLYVLALKAHFPESLLMVVTSVNGWTHRHRRLWNTASVCIHSAGASLYCLIAFCQRGYSCRAKGFSHVSRWNDSEPSIVCPSRADLLQAWKQWKKKRTPTILHTIHHPLTNWYIVYKNWFIVILTWFFHSSLNKQIAPYWAK